MEVQRLIGEIIQIRKPYKKINANINTIFTFTFTECFQYSSNMIYKLPRKIEMK